MRRLCPLASLPAAAALALGMPTCLQAAVATLAPANLLGADDRNSSGGLQCVPFARAVSGIRLYGDAWTWWDQARGHYARGTSPRVGAVMNFAPYGAMRLGHVAVVSRIIDARTLLLRHANWSPIDGKRGQIENSVTAIDVSPAGDWSQVRVWFAPIQNLGTTHWPVRGFIYPDRSAMSGRGNIHGVVDDPIGAIIAAHQTRVPEVRAAMFRPVPRQPAGPVAVTRFTVPVSVSPPPHRRRLRLDRGEAS